MSKVLLIWEEVPENTKLYLIPSDVASKYESYLKSAHGHFINASDWEEYEGLFFLNTALGEEAPEEGFEDCLGIFRQYEVSTDQPITGETITAVYFSGFLL